MSVAVDEFDVDVFLGVEVENGMLKLNCETDMKIEEVSLMKKLKVIWKRMNWMELNCEIELWNWKYFEGRNFVNFIVNLIY